MAILHCSFCGEVDTSKATLCEHLEPQFNLGTTPLDREELEILRELLKEVRTLGANVAELRKAVTDRAVPW